MSRNGRLAFSGTASSGRSSFTATGNVDGRTCVSISRVKLLQSMAASWKDAATRCAVILCRKRAKTKAGGDALDCAHHSERRDCPTRALCPRSKESTGLLDCFGVAGFVLANLVQKEIVNGVESARIGGL